MHGFDARRVVLYVRGDLDLVCTVWAERKWSLVVALTMGCDIIAYFVVRQEMGIMGAFGEALGCCNHLVFVLSSGRTRFVHNN